MNRSALIVLFAFACSCAQKTDYEKIATYQDHAVASLNIEANAETRVLMIFPHADDEIVVAGLSEYLREQGATIHLLTLTNTYNPEQVESRLSELKCAGHHLGLAQVETAGLTNNTWENVMSNQIEFWYDHQDSIKTVIKNKIDRYQPHMLITYDTEIGGYGHPEHYISAKLTEELFHDYRQNSAAYAPEILLQSTLPEKLEELLAAPIESYELTKSITGSSGLPDPDFSLDIKKFWPLKNRAGQCYQSQIRTLNKFYMVYEEKNAEAHINAFSNEYYTVIE